MRAERITPRNAAAAWEAVQRVYKGSCILPTLDLGAIFAGRKTVTWREALEAIKLQIDAANE